MRHESLLGCVRHRKVRHPYLAVSPRGMTGCLLLLWPQAHAKERQLEAVEISLRRLKIAGEVPPLGAEPGMAAVIGRKCERAWCVCHSEPWFVRCAQVAKSYIVT